MTYAASLLKQEIARRMGGDCRLNVRTGQLRSMDGERQDSCASCPGHCLGSKHATGLVGATLQVTVVDRGGGTVMLSWACPRCARETTEEATVLTAPAVAKEVESDPLCFRCRSAAS